MPAQIERNGPATRERPGPGHQEVSPVPEQAYPQSKRCPQCGVTMPLEGFHRNRSRPDGRQRLCKECRNAYMRGWKDAHPEQTRRVSAAWERRNREKMLASGQAWRKKNPEKWQAHGIVERAIARGILKRPPACSECEEVGPVQAHHDDYSLPLDVRWLCRACHSREHRKYPR